MVEDTFKSVLALLIIAIAYVAAFPIAFQFAGGALNRNWGKGMNFLRKQQSRVVKKGVETGKRNAGVKITGFVKKNWDAKPEEDAGRLGKMSATGRRTLAQALAYGKQKEQKRAEQEEQIKRGWQDIHAARSLQGTEEGGYSRYTQKIGGKNQADLERSLSGAVATVASREAEESKNRQGLLLYRSNQAGVDMKSVVNQLNDFAQGRGDGYIRNESTGKGFRIDANTVLAGHDVAANSGEVPALRNYLTSRSMHEALGTTEAERQEGRRKIDKILETNRGTIMNKGGWDLVNQGENLAYGRRMETKDSKGKGTGRYVEANDEAGKRAAMINAELSTFAADDAANLKDYKVGQVSRLAKGLGQVSTRVENGKTVRYTIDEAGRRFDLTGIDDAAWAKLKNNTTQAVTDARLVPALGSKSGDIDTMAGVLGIEKGLAADGKTQRDIEKPKLNNQSSETFGGYSEVDIAGLADKTTAAVSRVAKDAVAHNARIQNIVNGSRVNKEIKDVSDAAVARVVVDLNNSGHTVSPLASQLNLSRVQAGVQKAAQGNIITKEQAEKVAKQVRESSAVAGQPTAEVDKAVKAALDNFVIVSSNDERAEAAEQLPHSQQILEQVKVQEAARRSAIPERGVNLSPGQAAPAPQYQDQAPPVRSQSTPGSAPLTPEKIERAEQRAAVASQASEARRVAQGDTPTWTPSPETAAATEEMRRSGRKFTPPPQPTP